MSKDNEKAIYVGLILNHHFAVRHPHTHEAVCAGCGMEVPWPCSSVLLARIVKDEIA